MSKSGLFAHFGSKEELQLATIETASSLFTETVIEPALEAPTGLEQLRQLAEGFLQHVQGGVYPGGCFFASVAAELDTHPGPVRDLAVRVIEEWYGQLRRPSSWRSRKVTSSPTGFRAAHLRAGLLPAVGKRPVRDHSGPDADAARSPRDRASLGRSRAPLSDTSFQTDRLTITALAVDDADELVGVLGDPRLHEFIGGAPASLDELRDRYRGLVAGSRDPAELWLNWIVRTLDTGTAIGTLQATISTASDGRTRAHVAWVIGLEWQGQGYAAEAAGGLVEWLAGCGVDEVLANIHPDHHASGGVARRAGLHPTGERRDGETVWRFGPPTS